ncbi:MAG: virulence factor [Rhodospirillales bacterium]
MASLTIVYWRDIPAQVIVKRGREAAKRQLPERFQQAIDAAAMRARLVGTDAYLNEWRRSEPRDCGEDLEAEAAACAAKLEAEYDDARLAKLVGVGGNAAKG